MKQTKRDAGQQPYKGQAPREAGTLNPVSQLSGALAGAVFQQTPGLIPTVRRIHTLGKFAIREEERKPESVYSPTSDGEGDNGGFLIHLE